mmetsp:Transcript_5685/g.10195  ORF Transcript_5685/g.10195 Transcript_5685/m.10195 type:complete len:318 (+) Transcript_5685:292-1245(+)
MLVRVSSVHNLSPKVVIGDPVLASSLVLEPFWGKRNVEALLVGLGVERHTGKGNVRQHVFGLSIFEVRNPPARNKARRFLKLFFLLSLEELSKCEGRVHKASVAAHRGDDLCVEQVHDLAAGLAPEVSVVVPVFRCLDARNNPSVCFDVANTNNFHVVGVTVLKTKGRRKEERLTDAFCQLLHIARAQVLSFNANDTMLPDFLGNLLLKLVVRQVQHRLPAEIHRGKSVLCLASRRYWQHHGRSGRRKLFCHLTGSTNPNCSQSDPRMRPAQALFNLSTTCSSARRPNTPLLHCCCSALFLSFPLPRAALIRFCPLP